MTWAEFYLLCFAVGFIFSLLAVVSGSGHFHVPHVRLHTGHGSASPINAGTIAAFLAWFGGAGYLLTSYSLLGLFLALGLAVVIGIAGAAIVFWFVAKLSADERAMDPADYEMIGVLGRVSSPMRAGGTGEMMYSREGARRACAIRGEDGAAISRDTEVVVTRYEKGIAYVRRWDELTSAPDEKSAGVAGTEHNS